MRWPGGRTQSFHSVPINRRVFVEEGKDDVRDEPFREASRPSASGPSASTTDATETTASTWLYRPFPAPPFAARDLAGQDHSLASLAGRPAVLLFWAAGAPGSVGQNFEPGKGEDRRSAGIEEGGDPPANLAGLHASEVGVEVGHHHASVEGEASEPDRQDDPSQESDRKRRQSRDLAQRS